MSVRDAVPEDAAAIGRIKRDGWRAAYRRLISDDVLDRLDVDQLAADFGHRLSRLHHPTESEAAMLVAAVAGTTSGYVNLGPYRWDDLKGVGEVYALYVDPATWRNGVGKALMVAAEDRLQSLGYREAALWVLEANELGRRFYESIGWRCDGTTGERCEVENAEEIRYRRALTST